MNQENLRNTHVSIPMVKLTGFLGGAKNKLPIHILLPNALNSRNWCSFICHDVHFISNMLRAIGTLPQETNTNPTQNTSMSIPSKIAANTKICELQMWEVKWSGTQILTPVGFFSGGAQWFLGIRKIQISHLLHSSFQWSKNRLLNSRFKSQKNDLHFHMLRKWGTILSKTTISHPTQSTKHLNVDSNKNTNSFSTPNLEPDPHQSHFHLEQPKISGTKESPAPNLT